VNRLNLIIGLICIAFPACGGELTKAAGAAEHGEGEAAAAMLKAVMTAGPAAPVCNDALLAYPYLGTDAAKNAIAARYLYALDAAADGSVFEALEGFLAVGQDTRAPADIRAAAYINAARYSAGDEAAGYLRSAWDIPAPEGVRIRAARLLREHYLAADDEKNAKKLEKEFTSTYPGEEALRQLQGE
jgi:hypothetical protein